MATTGGGGGHSQVWPAYDWHRWWPSRRTQFPKRGGHARSIVSVAQRPQKSTRGGGKGDGERRSKKGEQDKIRRAEGEGGGARRRDSPRSGAGGGDGARGTQDAGRRKEGTHARTNSSSTRKQAGKPPCPRPLAWPPSPPGGLRNDAALAPPPAPARPPLMPKPYLVGQGTPGKILNAPRKIPNTPGKFSWPSKFRGISKGIVLCPGIYRYLYEYGFFVLEYFLVCLISHRDHASEFGKFRVWHCKAWDLALVWVFADYFLPL